MGEYQVTIVWAPQLSASYAQVSIVNKILPGICLRFKLKENDIVSNGIHPTGSRIHEITLIDLFFQRTSARFKSIDGIVTFLASWHCELYEKTT